MADLTPDTFPEGFWISTHSEPVNRDGWDCWRTVVLLHEQDKGTVSEAYMYSTGAPGTQEHRDCIEIMTSILKRKARALRA